MHERVGSAYLDASALIKLARQETDSKALREFSESIERFSSEIARIELKRSAHRNAPGSVSSLETVEAVADATELIPMDRKILQWASDLPHPDLGSLDAIHVSTALRAAPLDCFVTYDMQQARAARAVGLNVVIPRDR